MHRFSRDRWLHEKVAPDPSSPFSSRPLLSSAKLSFRDNRSKTMFLEIDQWTKIEIRNLGHRDAYPRLLCAVHCALEDERGEAKTKLLFNPWALRRTLFDIGFHTGCVWRRRLFVEGDRRERERKGRVKADIKRDDSFVSVYIIPATRNICMYTCINSVVNRERFICESTIALLFFANPFRLHRLWITSAKILFNETNRGERHWG